MPRGPGGLNPELYYHPVIKDFVAPTDTMVSGFVIVNVNAQVPCVSHPLMFVVPEL